MEMVAATDARKQETYRAIGEKYREPVRGAVKAVKAWLNYAWQQRERYTAAHWTQMIGTASMRKNGCSQAAAN